MNDRSVGLLDNYDIEVLRTWKGRGAILCETREGILILKEYGGHREKAAFQDALLRHVQEMGFKNVHQHNRRSYFFIFIYIKIVLTF